MTNEKVWGYWKVSDNGKRARMIRQDAVADEITERIIKYFFHEGITYKAFLQLDFFPYTPAVSPLLNDLFIERESISKRDKVCMYRPLSEGLLFKIGIGEYKEEKPSEEEFNQGWFIWGISSNYPHFTNHGSIKLPGNKDAFHFSRKLNSENFIYGVFQKAMLKA